MGQIIGPHGQRLREKLTETGVTIMGNEGYGTSMHATEDLTDGGFMTEAVTKYVERSIQVEEQMLQIEENSEGKFPMMSMQQPPHPTCYKKKTHSTPHT